ncbi:hypothetical protein cypCar_00037354, partial [Cyprinus carpio]
LNVCLVTDDFSRVKLISLHNDEGSDYINANFIPGYNSPHEFIATQGPLPETRNDFWNMVLQQKSHIIVMLTQCNERRRVKCDHYWPFTEEPVAYGDITVEMLSETDSPEWTVRNFRLGYADETQDILHFNYTSWPDHGVPTVNAIESILQFVQIVRQQVSRTKGPIVVHCSAGVGRTGTFIALDRLMQHIQEHESDSSHISVNRCVTSTPETNQAAAAEENPSLIYSHRNSYLVDVRRNQFDALKRAAASSTVRRAKENATALY